MDPQVWASLLTLTALEIVLGIDNLVFIAILAGRLPPERRDRARRVGLGLALITRLALLASITWIMSLTTTLFAVFGHAVSWRDITRGRAKSTSASKARNWRKTHQPGAPALAAP
jgi:predicted tellurium resistance membrane protein TerC